MSAYLNLSSQVEGEPEVSLNDASLEHGQLLVSVRLGQDVWLSLDDPEDARLKLRAMQRAVGLLKEGQRQLGGVQ
jgi:hypothetical protein